jgi:hypothetical protein
MMNANASMDGSFDLEKISGDSVTSVPMVT